VEMLNISDKGKVY